MKDHSGRMGCGCLGIIGVVALLWLSDRYGIIDGSIEWFKWFEAVGEGLVGRRPGNSFSEGFQGAFGVVFACFACLAAIGGSMLVLASPLLAWGVIDGVFFAPGRKRAESERLRELQAEKEAEQTRLAIKAAHAAELKRRTDFDRAKQNVPNLFENARTCQQRALQCIGYALNSYERREYNAFWEWVSESSSAVRASVQAAKQHEDAVLSFQHLLRTNSDLAATISSAIELTDPTAIELSVRKLAACVNEANTKIDFVVALNTLRTTKVIQTGFAELLSEVRGAIRTMQKPGATRFDTLPRE